MSNREPTHDPLYNHLVKDYRTARRELERLEDTHASRVEQGRAFYKYETAVMLVERRRRELQGD